MKKLFFVLVSMMMVCAMQATIIEENEPALIYYTPKTVLALDFTYTVEKEEVGPYAQFAADMLGATDFVKENKTVYTLQNVMIGTKAEADPTRPHKVVPEKGLDMQLLRLNEKNILVGYNIPVETEKAAHPKHHTSTTEGVKSRITSIHVAPYPEEVLKAGTPQAQAYEIAKQIFHIRETRMYLLSGEVEHAPADGKAMELVLAELDKQERELTELFVGKRSVTTEHKRIMWDHITRDNYMVRASQKDFLYFSEENGFTDKDNVDADSITIFIGHRAQGYTLPHADKNSKKGEALSQISYNLPGSAIVRIIYQGRLLGERTIPVAQLGVDVPLPQSLFTGKQLPKIQFNEKTGNIISISK